MLSRGLLFRSVRSRFVGLGIGAVENFWTVAGRRGARCRVPFLREYFVQSASRFIDGPVGPIPTVEVATKVVAIRVQGDGQGTENPGLEPLTEPIRQACHLRRIAKGLIPLIKLMITSLKRGELGLPASQLDGTRRLALLGRQLSQPVESGEIGGIDRVEAFQRAPLRRDITSPRGQPGRQPRSLRRSRLLDRQMLYGLPCLRDAIGRDRPVRTGTPRPRHLPGDAAGRR